MYSLTSKLLLFFISGNGNREICGKRKILHERTDTRLPSVVTKFVNVSYDIIRVILFFISIVFWKVQLRINLGSSHQPVP